MDRDRSVVEQYYLLLCANASHVDDDEEQWPSAEDVNTAIEERSATDRAKASQGGAEHSTWRREAAGGRVEEDAGRAPDTEEEKEEEDDRLSVIQSPNPAKERIP
eukprot:scaffold1049_cov430-Pinguiococcus_pyrenoidosus.AAC.1